MSNTQTDRGNPETWPKPTTARLLCMNGMSRFGLACPCYLSTNNRVCNTLYLVHDKQQPATVQTFSLTVPYSFKTHQQNLQKEELKRWSIWNTSRWPTVFAAYIHADMDAYLPLSAGEDSHLSSERRYSYPESITEVGKGLKGCQIRW